VRDADGADVSARIGRAVVEPWTIAADVRAGEGRADVPVVISASPLRSGAGRLNGAVFVIRDMRREREIDQMKTEFIANVSHELRTPLTPIKGYGDLLATRSLDGERVQRFGSEIAIAARQLERIVDQLVQFATIAAGRLRLATEPVPAGELVDAAMARWNDRLDERHGLTKRVVASLPAIQVDRRTMDMALDELIDNAVKYSPDGGRIRLSAAGGENGHTGWVTVTVQDDGVGVPPDRVESIFDDFSQGDGSATRRFGGLGLGLALVSRVVRAHGGELSCESRPGRGTKMSMRLPVAESAPARPPTTRRRIRAVRDE
jgi:signal transduction histidine kinase